VFFFPGSTIGQLRARNDARRFLARLAELAGPGAALVLGADLEQPDTEALLSRPYDDPHGVNRRRSNLNVLAHPQTTHQPRPATFRICPRSSTARCGTPPRLAGSRCTWSAGAARVVEGRRRGDPRWTAARAIVTSEHCYTSTRPDALAALLLATAGCASVQVVRRRRRPDAALARRALKPSRADVIDRRR